MSPGLGLEHCQSKIVDQTFLSAAVAVLTFCCLWTFFGIAIMLLNESWMGLARLSALLGCSAILQLRVWVKWQTWWEACCSPFFQEVAALHGQACQSSTASYPKNCETQGWPKKFRTYTPKPISDDYLKSGHIEVSPAWVTFLRHFGKLRAIFWARMWYIGAVQ